MANRMRSPMLDGVGATSEHALEALLPLIDYYTREMGELPGRLMIALNFLGDAQLTPGWDDQAPESRQAVEAAQALVVSVMMRLLNAQATAFDLASPSPLPDGVGALGDEDRRASP